MKQQITILKVTATALLAIEFEDTFLEGGCAIAQIDGMRGGASLETCFGQTEFLDSRPYSEALRTNYPGCIHDASKLLYDGIARQSIPMVLAAMLLSRYRLEAMLEPLSITQLITLLRLLCLSVNDKDFSYMISAA